MNPLIESDRESPTWKRIKEALQSELDRLREANDSMDREGDAEKTTFRRGRIQQIKEQLRWDEQHKPIPNRPRTY